MDTAVDELEGVSELRNAENDGKVPGDISEWYTWPGEDSEVLTDLGVEAEVSKRYPCGINVLKPFIRS